MKQYKMYGDHKTNQFHLVNKYGSFIVISKEVYESLLQYVISSERVESGVWAISGPLLNTVHTIELRRELM